MTLTSKLQLPLILGSDSMNPTPPIHWKDLFTKLDAQVGFKVCTSTTRPGTPYSGQIIYETDTHLHRIWSTVDSAWVLITGTPLGLISYNGSLLSVTNTTLTEAMIGTLTFNSYYNHYYRFHVEGYIKNSTNSTNLQSKVNIRYADGATSATTASPLSDSVFCDPLNLTASPTGIDVKAPFVFDAVQKSASANAQSTVGISFVNSGSVGSSGSIVGAVTLISIEDMGYGSGT